MIRCVLNISIEYRIVHLSCNKNCSVTYVETDIQYDYSMSSALYLDIDTCHNAE